MPVPVGFYEATFLFSNDDSSRISTSALGFLFLGVTPPTASEAANDLQGISSGSGMPFAGGEMIDDWSFEGVSVAQGTSEGDLVGQELVTVPGTVTDSTVPMNCSLIVQKNTALGGRRNRGRMFIPPIILNDGAVDVAGNIAPGPLATIQGNFNDWYAALVAADWEPALFHQGAGAPVPTAITSFTVQSLIGTQRRRMRS
jgi:hypothetical protein